ncbi:MAG: hypothetical protein LBG52_01195 [Candidatus Peribacteria bacterium]|jgi:hypothetical protein|nr:hypothetical protein [Candidatus Peribacteria bacterium]
MTTYTSRKTYEFVSKQTNDPIVEWKTCKVSGQPFPIYQSDLEFYEKISPTFNGKKYPIPTPTLCPEERQRRRLERRNERKLYKRKSDLSGVEMISIYSPDKPYTIYSAKEWRSDQWNPLDYGRDFDFSCSFFEQFDELLKTVPKQGLINMNTINSEYCNYAENSKNCYLTHRLYDDCENILYSYRVTYQSKDCSDLYMVNGTSFSYELIDGRNCYGCCYGYKLS